MPLTRIDQGYHYDGCFVAAVATVMGTSYEEGFKLVHPTRDFEKDKHGVKRKDPKGPSKFVYRKLKELGLKPKKSKHLCLNRLKRTAICIIRWSWAPHLLHAIVWDAEARKFLDPSGPVPYRTEEYQRQVETIIYLETKNDQLDLSGHRWSPQQQEVPAHNGQVLNP